MKKIAFVGSGNVAWHLSKLFQDHAYPVCCVWSQSKESATRLAKHLGNDTLAISGKQELDLTNQDIDLVVMSVADGAYEEVLQDLTIPKNAVLVHTSGSQALSILDQYHEKTGVFYPLQTFSKTKEVDFTSIPFCIESQDLAIEKELTRIASQFSKKVFTISSKDRRILHVAAVFACNFANHLWSVSEEILKSKDLPFDILEPLLKETLHKALEIRPSNAQTGPAIRKDAPVIESHLNFLESYPSHFVEIYRLITKSIQDKKA